MMTDEVPQQCTWPRRRRQYGGRVLWLGLLVVVGAGLLGGCSLGAPPVVKIGLIAPFEGPSRPLGYEVLHAVQLRLQEWNESGATPRVELVALNDDGDPDLAALLPAQLAADAGVIIVLGPPQSHTAAAAAPILATHHIPAFILAPVPDLPRLPVVAFGGTAADVRAAIAGKGTATALAWAEPLTEPSIWLGEPRGLAHLLLTQPADVIGAGPVGAEAAVGVWAGGAAEGLMWAAAYPDDLPSDFAAKYEKRFGAAPTPAAALAYSSASTALDLLAVFWQRDEVAAAMPALSRPPMLRFVRGDAGCCVPLSGAP